MPDEPTPTLQSAIQEHRSDIQRLAGEAITEVLVDEVPHARGFARTCREAGEEEYRSAREYYTNLEPTCEVEIDSCAPCDSVEEVTPLDNPYVNDNAEWTGVITGRIDNRSRTPAPVKGTFTPKYYLVRGLIIMEKFANNFVFIEVDPSGDIIESDTNPLMNSIMEEFLGIDDDQKIELRVEKGLFKRREEYIRNLKASRSSTVRGENFEVQLIEGNSPTLRHNEETPPF